MPNSKIVLDRQASAQTFEFGTTSALGQGLVTIRKGTAGASTVGLVTEGSINVGGDLNLTGNLNITGSINETSVTNLSVTDLTVRVNKGGTTSGAAAAGIQVEGDSASLIGAISYNSASATKFQIGDGTTQRDIVDISSVQTLTNKSISASQITGTLGVANGGTGATTLTGVLIGNGTGAFTTKTNPSGAFVGDTDSQTLTNKTLTNPRISQINDATNGLASLLFVAPTSSVNQMTHTSAVTGQNPTLSATGIDTNISLNLVSKGNGVIQANGVEVVTLSGTQTLTNKSISGGQITSAVALATTVTTNANLNGDVTSVGNASTISNNAVTLSKIQQVTSSTLLGRSTSGTGNVEVLTVGSGLSISGGVLNTTGGTGTVTSVSVLTANGVSGSIATSTTTPAITITLGAITPTSVNGLNLTSQTNGFTLAGGTSSATLTVASNANVSGTHSGTSSGTNSGDQIIILTGAVTGSGTGSFVTTLAQYFRKTNVSGTQDGVNKTYSIANALLTNSEIVSLNGQLLNSGSSNDYILTGTSLVFQAAFTAPSATDVILVSGVY